jgi:Pyruvate/2-oxoacid:ferredoxin oxidoreductase delta subunit
MSDTAYHALREFLDRYPLGFPQTESGVEIEILKRLFTEEEARLAVRLSPFLEEIGQIAERLGMEVDSLAEELEGMVRKGLVFRVRRGGTVSYRAAPFMIGLYEYSVKRIDKELAALYAEYYEAAYLDEMGASDVPGFKVIPVEENIEAGDGLLPYHKLEESVRAARRIAVTDCVCRKESSLLGESCDHPMEACLSFGAAADYYVESGLGREITADEAIGILERADASGLVHAGANSKHLSNICNCCPCCCASMKGITKRGYDKHKYVNALFEAVVDEAECSVCDLCVDRCPVGAIAVEDTASVDRDKCLGCGLCASDCPTDAIRLVLRPDREEPFDRISEMGRAVLKGKQANAEKAAARTLSKA